MAAHVNIKDGLGSNELVGVSDNAIRVSILNYPPAIPQKIRVFRQYLTDDGTPTGSNDMGVDGSSTNQDFYVASNENDRYITSLSIVVGYALSGAPYEWADGTALSNGSRLFYSSQLGEVDIHDALQRNQDLFRLQGRQIPTAWEVRHVNAANDFGYFITIPISEIMPNWGLKLNKGTKERLTMRIRDDAGANADTFNCIALGFERFE